MKRRRYHVVVLREDGKQYHNRVLDFFYVRKKISYMAGALLVLLLGNLAFLYLASRQGYLEIERKRANDELEKTRDSLFKVKDDLAFMQQQLRSTEQRLYQLEHLAKEQNLTIPRLSLPGTGGGSFKSSASSSGFLSDPELNRIYNKVIDAREYAETLSKETQELDAVLNPHLVSLSRKPSVWPVKGFISSAFGGRPDPITGSPSWHQGLDISAPNGTPVVATAEGYVASAEWMSGLGNTVVINHGDGVVTLYGHLSKWLVKPGQKIKRWERIGLVGSSGRSTGNHCHYEIHIDGKPVNPTRYIIY